MDIQHWRYGNGSLRERKKETHCHHFMGYSFQLAARDLLYAHPTDVVYTAFVTPDVGPWDDCDFKNPKQTNGTLTNTNNKNVFI